MESNIFEKKVDRESFLARYENSKTRLNAELALGAFDWYLTKNFPNISDQTEYFAQLKKVDDHTLYTEIDRIVQFWYTDGVREPNRRKINPGLSVSAVNNYFSFLKTWFRTNGIKLDSGMIKDYVRWRKPLKEKRRVMDKSTGRMIAENMRPKYRTFFKFTCESGVRIKKEGLNLEVRDIDFSGKIPKITVRAEIAKTKTERITFCSPETGAEIKQFNIKDKGPTEKVFDFTYDSYYNHFRVITKRLGLDEKYTNGWNCKLNPYKARKYARTQLSSIDKDFAEAIIGHENISNLYYEKSDDDMAKIYETAIPTLQLSDESQLRNENRTLKEQVSIVNSQQIQIQAMEDQIKRLQDMISNGTKS